MAVIDNLVSYWSLDEASGDAVDAHGSNTLTETSGSIVAATGKVGGARDFEDGDSEYFEHADNASLSTGDIDYSFCAWINLESTDTRKTILSKDAGTLGSDRDYALAYNPGVGGFRFQLDGTGLGSSDWVAGIFTGTWCFICCGHSATSNQTWISLNAGTPVANGTFGAAYDSSSPFRLGALANVGSEDYFDGLIDEVGFWKRDIRSDLTWLYNSGSGRSYADIVAESGGGNLPSGHTTGFWD